MVSGRYTGTETKTKKLNIPTWERDKQSRVGTAKRAHPTTHQHQLTNPLHRHSPHTAYKPISQQQQSARP